MFVNARNSYSHFALVYIHNAVHEVLLLYSIVDYITSTHNKYSYLCSCFSYLLLYGLWSFVTLFFCWLLRALIISTRTFAIVFVLFALVSSIYNCYFLRLIRLQLFFSPDHCLHYWLHIVQFPFPRVNIFLPNLILIKLKLKKTKEKI